MDNLDDLICESFRNNLIILSPRRYNHRLYYGVYRSNKFNVRRSKYVDYSYIFGYQYISR